MTPGVLSPLPHPFKISNVFQLNNYYFFFYVYFHFCDHVSHQEKHVFCDESSCQEKRNFAFFVMRSAISIHMLFLMRILQKRSFFLLWWELWSGKMDFGVFLWQELWSGKTDLYVFCDGKCYEEKAWKTFFGKISDERCGSFGPLYHRGDNPHRKIHSIHVIL